MRLFPKFGKSIHSPTTPPRILVKPLMTLNSEEPHSLWKQIWPLNTPGPFSCLTIFMALVISFTQKWGLYRQHFLHFLSLSSPFLLRHVFVTKSTVGLSKPDIMPASKLLIKRNRAHSKRPNTGLICKCLIESSAISLVIVTYNDIDLAETGKLYVSTGRPEAGKSVLG